MRHIFSYQVIKGKYSKWIFILQQFDSVFATANVKKSLVSAAILLDLRIVYLNEIAHGPLPITAGRTNSISLSRK